MSIKTRRMISLVCFVLSITGLLLLLSWFYVRGTEFRFLKALPEASEIVCTKQTWNLGTGDYETEEFHLTQNQLTDVLTLVRKNAYWRILSSTITHDEDVSYYISCEFLGDARQEYLIISFVGNYAVTITSSVGEFNHEGFLRILSKDFMNELEAILTK